MSGVAVVTGAGKGLGAAIATRLHTDGMSVVLADIDVEAATETASRLNVAGSAAVAAEIDVREKGSFLSVLASTVDRFGPVDVLVNNAGLSKPGAVMDISPEEFLAVVNVNLTGAFIGCQVFGAHFAENGYGRIVNIASLAGQNGGTATGAHYASAKGGVATLTKVFARDLASSGVTVNAVSPGPLDLPIVRETVPAEKLAGILSTIPVGQLGSPEFVADAVALLASRGASSVTGACWDINGGLFMR